MLPPWMQVRLLLGDVHALLLLAGVCCGFQLVSALSCVLLLHSGHR